MANLRISELATLAGSNLAAGDFLPVADVSASETKKITVTDLVGKATTLIADATIPGAKILFTSGTIPGSALANGAVDATQLATDAVTAAKLGDESTVDLVTTLPGSGAFVGQLALDTDDSKIYCWNGSTWVSIKSAGSVNTVIGSTAGIINLVVTTDGDQVTITTSIDDTSAAAQFLAGPTSAAGAVSYRTIAGGDLPTASTTVKGGVIVNGSGLTMSGSTVQINNTVAANTSTYQAVQYSANGLVTAGRNITGADLPVATSGTIGAVLPGSGLAVSGTGELSHTNAATPGQYTKVTVDTEGHVTAGTTLADTDIPNIPASKLTSGTLSNSLFGTNSITGAKLANFATVKFGGAGSTENIVTFPIPDYTGQMFFDSSNGDLYLFDGNTYQPITVISGDLVYAGTYNASTNLVASTTTQGSAAGFTAGAALPAASATNVRFYVVVANSGTGVSPAPAVALAPPDMLVSNGATYDLVDVSNAIAGQTASNISFTPYGNLAANNVQVALQELDDEKLAKVGGTVTGELLIGNAGSLKFEGSTADDYETQITVVDPTADRTVTIPNQSGTVILSGNTSIVNADISTSAAIAFSKLATLSSGTILVGNGSNVATGVAVSGDVSLSNAGVATVVSGSTSTAGKLQLTDSINSTSTTTAATPNAVKTAYDLANAALTSAAIGVTVQGYDADTAKTDVAQSFSKAQRGSVVTLTDGATITPDFSLGNNFSVTLGGSRTLANPTNLTAGQSGVIVITQDGTGSRLLSYGGYFKFPGGTAPTLTTTASAVDVLAYYVDSSTRITARLVSDVK
jgi:hypothetical protein